MSLMQQLLYVRTTDKRRPKKPVTAEKSNVPGEVTAKEIVINSPLIGLFANPTCKFIWTKYESSIRRFLRLIYRKISIVTFVQLSFYSGFYLETFSLLFR